MESVVAITGVMLLFLVFLVWAHLNLQDGENPDHALQRAQKASEGKNWDEAIEAATVSIKGKPSLKAFLLRARCHSQKEEWELAAHDYTSALHFSKSSTHYFNRGLCWAFKGDYVSALQDFNEALKDMSNANGHYNRAIIYVQCSDYLKAYEDINHSIVLFEENIPFDLDFSSYAFCHSYCHYLTYRAHISHLQKNLPAAINDLNKVLKLCPLPAYYALRRSYLFSIGDHSGAAEDHRQQILLETEGNPEKPVLNNGLQQRYDEGVTAAKAKSWDKAITALTEVILHKPFRKAFHIRAHCYFYKEEYGLAVEDFSAAIALRPSPFSYYRRARTYGAMSEWSKSRDDISLAITYAQDIFGSSAKLLQARYLNYRSYILLRMYHVKDSLDDINQAILLDAAGYRYLLRSHCYFAQCQYDAALADLQHALTLNEEDDGAHNSIAWFLATCPDDRYRDGKKAVEHALKAQAQGGLRLPYIGTLAAAYAETGKFTEAIDWARKFLESNKVSENLPMATRRLELYERGIPYRSERGKLEFVKE